MILLGIFDGGSVNVHARHCPAHIHPLMSSLTFLTVQVNDIPPLYADRPSKIPVQKAFRGTDPKNFVPLKNS